MKAVFQLVRWPNLIIIAYCMYVLRYSLLIPLLQLRGVDPVLPHLYFMLIVIACILTAAAGYIINDIYDRAIDKINKPERVIIGERISVRQAENLYIAFNVIAIAIGVYISYKTNLRSLSLLFPLVAGILYFYSTTYKTILLFGNILIAAMSALIPFTVILFELPLLHQKYQSFLGSSGFNFNLVIFTFVAYSVFAFIISLFREVIKDIEDFEGDKAFGKNTLPVAYGTPLSKIFAIILIIILIIAIGFIAFKYLFDPISLTYLIGFLIAPLVYITLLLVKAGTPSNFAFISQVSKIVMLLGITYAFVLGNFILKY
ncbi:MAG: geranylgeranylglycerol-phosphate geranylgeranyltransferase [Bacteroidales bacterium]|nr:geranylgeranylglycerol-phosphate geranylgeranyltransferase [Bacteroidales bacterium]